MSDIKSVNIRGLVDTYEFPCKLPGSDLELKIRPITTGQMKKILTYEDETDPYIVDDALDSLMSSCVVNEDFDIKSLKLQDRFALLLELRKVTKGDSYSFTSKCPKCKLENASGILLSELPVTPYEVSDNVVVINDKLSFELDFPTRGDQLDAINRYRKKSMNWREKDLNIQTGTYANCIRKVHTPDGVIENVPFDDKVFILENITSDVFKRITTWFESNNFGVDFSFTTKCVHCMYEHKVEIPLNDFFI